MDLKKRVREKIAELGVAESAKFFGVSVGTASNWSTGKTSPSIEAAELLIGDLQEAQQPDELTHWMGREVFIGIPAYRSINPETHYTLFANYAKYGPEKIAMQMIKRTTIHEGRNILIDKFMQTDAKRIIMVDDDMVIPFGNAAYINSNHQANLPVEIAGRVGLSRLLSHGSEKGVVGGLYFGRHRAGKAQCSGGFESDAENAKFHRHEYEGAVAQRWVGTGWIKIERWVIEKMRAHIDAGNWPELKPENDTRWYGYFTPLKVGVGEDVSFGVRCGKIGIQSYVDAGLECLHIGDRSYCSTNTSYSL